MGANKELPWPRTDHAILLIAKSKQKKTAETWTLRAYTITYVFMTSWPTVEKSGSDEPKEEAHKQLQINPIMTKRQTIAM